MRITRQSLDARIGAMTWVQGIEDNTSSFICGLSRDGFSCKNKRGHYATSMEIAKEPQRRSHEEYPKWAWVQKFLNFQINWKFVFLDGQYVQLCMSWVNKNSPRNVKFFCHEVVLWNLCETWKLSSHFCSPFFHFTTLESLVITQF